MVITEVSAGAYYLPANKASKSLPESYDKEIKTLKNFKDLLGKEIKAVKKSKMDAGFKQGAIEEADMQMRMVDNKIQQLTADKRNLANTKLNDGVTVKTATITYGVSYLA
jgi:hypothetical protein